MKEGQLLKGRTDVVALASLVFILAVVPTIVVLRQVPMVGILETYWTSDPNVDFFSYYKMVWFLIANFFLMIGFFLYLHFNEKGQLKSTIYYLPMAIYAFFIILSTLFAEHFTVALKGFPDRYEGMLVLLGYVFVLFVTINLVNSKRQIKILLGGLGVSSLILSIFGFFQFFGYDFLRTDLGKRMMLPADLYQYAEQLSFTFGPYTIYSTMYNTNYVGSYMVMLFCLSLAIFILVEKMPYKILCGAFNVLLYTNLIGSRSRAGLLGCLVAVVFLAFLLRKKIRPNIVPIAIVIVCYLLLFFSMNYASGNTLTRGLSLARGIRDLTVTTTVGNIQDLVIEDKDMIIVTDDITLHARLTDDNSLLFFDEDGEEISFVFYLETDDIELQHEDYEDFQLKFMQDDNVLNFQYGRARANFLLTEDGFWIVGLGNQAYRTEEIESWFFEGRERFASNRGYMWSRSLPLLKDTWFLGTGPDTFAIYFPQNDNVGKLKTFGGTRFLVDKPHNMYLQVGINTGLPSLLALLSLFGIYCYQSIKLFWKNEFKDLYSIVGVGLFTAFIGYAVAGQFNDSIVSVAPVFWVLLGIGISINLKLEEKTKSSTN